MSTQLRIPDLGEVESAEVIEVLVAPGDTLAEGDSVIVLESDKASMDVPADQGGRIVELHVQVGDRIQAGDALATLEAAEKAQDSADSDSDSDSDSESNKADNDQAAEARDEAEADAAKDKPAASSSERGHEAGPGEGKPKAKDKDKDTAKAAAADSNEDYDCDVVVIGAGPGGYSAAFRAADLGLRVVLVERHERLGGVCLNVGCIPSKTLLHAAKVIDEAAAMAEHGVQFGEPQIDVDKLRDFKQGVVHKLTGGLDQLVRQRKVKRLRGEARFVDAHTLAIRGEDDSRLRFAHAIIAVGSQAARLPGLPEDARVIDSTGALELPDIPQRLLVIGGGIIGLEMANVYAVLGSEVDVVEMTDSLIPGADADLVKPLRERMAQRLAHIWLSTKVERVEAGDDGLQVHFGGDKAPEPQAYDRVLVAVGRRANGDRIDADAAGVEVDERGEITVDAQMRSNIAHIHAIGDVTGAPQLAHRAVHQGKVAAEVIAGEKVAFEPRCIPSVVYTDPELAWTGLTESQAKARDIAYEKGQFPWAANGRSLGQANSLGLTKILFDPDSGRCLGAGAVGPNAGELIAELSLAIEMGADMHDIGLTIHPHPTLSETVGMAAEAAAGTLTDLYLPRKRKG